MGRFRTWLFNLLSRTATKPTNDDPLPRPTPGEIMACRVLIPVDGDRTPGEQICIVMFRLGYQKRLSEEKSPFTPASGTAAVFVDKAGQTQVQREMTQPAPSPDPLKSPYYIAQIHTQHSMPAVSPLRKSRLTQMLHDIPVPAAPPSSPRPSFQTRQLTPLPEEFEVFEDEDDAGLNDVTERREAV